MIAHRSVGSGPPLPLINGYAATGSDWDPTFLAALAESFEVICPDNRGVGGSEAGEGQLTIDGMAADCEVLLDALALLVQHCDIELRCPVSLPSEGQPELEALRHRSFGRREKAPALGARICRRGTRRGCVTQQRREAIVIERLQRAREFRYRALQVVAILGKQQAAGMRALRHRQIRRRPLLGGE
jgi:hypothetical protein